MKGDVVIYTNQFQKLKELVNLAIFCNFQFFASEIKQTWHPPKTAKLLGGKNVLKPVDLIH